MMDNAKLNRFGEKKPGSGHLAQSVASPVVLVLLALLLLVHRA